MTSIYYFEERFMPKEDVRISPDDRGYYFGDGVYEVFRVYAGEMFQEERHFARLRRSAEGVRLAAPDMDALKERLRELVRLNEVDEGNVYIQITRGSAPRNHPFPDGAKPVVMAYAKQAERPAATMEAGIRLLTAPDIRWLRCDLKTLNLLPNVLFKQQAIDGGAGDVLFHRNGFITECSSSNFAAVKDGALLTHPANELILHGVTRAVVIELAQGLGLTVRERPFTLEELAEAEEAFITGTNVEVTPVIQIDGRVVGAGEPGPITRRLQQAFGQAVAAASTGDKR